jgi:MGT family glycosyltransferase
MKIGFVSLPLSGHLNPMTMLGRSVQARGNEVVFIGVPDIESDVRAANLDFVPFCDKEYPPGSIPKNWSKVAGLHGLEAVQYTCNELFTGLCEASLEHLPQKIVETGVDALVLDTALWFVGLVPIRLNIPYIHIWNMLHIDISGATPPCFFSWQPYESSPAEVVAARRVEAMNFLNNALSPLVAIASSYAKKHGMQIDFSDPTATVSKLAIISQMPKVFDFKISTWPPEFQYAGPFHDDIGREQVHFPWEKLSGQPLIYASMGTVVNGLGDVYKIILKAVGALSGAQLVLSIGNNIDPELLERVPFDAIIVRSAPQIQILKRSVLCITHAGLNTTLESLAQGVPMVAIPISYDQPGVAARIAYHGVGEFIELEHLTARRQLDAIEKVRGGACYRETAQKFQSAIAKSRGLDVAANVIDEAFKKKSLKTN